MYKTKTLNMIVDKDELSSWQQMSDILCMNVYEYVRKCTGAHTTMLNANFFETIGSKEEMEKYYKENKLREKDSNGIAPEKQVHFDLWLTPKDYKKYKAMADILYLDLSEYIRRCAIAHTKILEMNSFNTIKRNSQK